MLICAQHVVCMGFLEQWLLIGRDKGLFKETLNGNHMPKRHTKRALLYRGTELSRPHETTQNDGTKKGELK